MKVTVITPCFNSEKTIEKTLESVLNQTYDDIEYIIIDGASTDRTLEIIKGYEDRFNSRFSEGIKIFSEKDNGIYDAMNKGIEKATGEIIGIVNSDDYYEKDAVENIVNARMQLFEEADNKATALNYQILYGMERLLEDGKETAVVINNHENLLNQMITHPTCFVTKKLYEDKGKFNLDYKYSADYEFMLRMYKDSQVVFTPVYKIISNYALGGASGTAAAYMETMKLMHEYGSISDKQYKFLKLKNSIYKLLGIV